jgi:Ca-activated chloride channel family protein
VVFITDGSVGYEDEMFSLIERSLGRARLFTVGIGSAPNNLFMRKAAEAGRGSFTLISALHEVQEKMDGLFRKLEHPQVTGIDVAWPSSVVVDSYPSVIPALYLGEPVTIKARLSGMPRAGDTIHVSGNTVSGGWSNDLALDRPAQDAGIAALWARARIGELMDAERRGGAADELRAAIVETAIAHHLVSKYTSLVAIDKTPVRPAGDPLSSEHLANLLPYGQSANAIFGFPATATNALVLQRRGLMLLLAALLLFGAGAQRRSANRARLA